MKRVILLCCSLLFAPLLTGCSGVYYDAMEQVGVHKRDILVSRVTAARDAQQQAQAEFKDALTQMKELTGFRGGELEQAYDKTRSAYEDSAAAAREVSERIDAVDAVANALFKEWEGELKQYSSAGLRRDSAAKLSSTRERYRQLLAAMRRAESTMAPVLATLKDNMLYLKHNLNAAAIGALRGEVDSLQRDVGRLLQDMDKSIRESEAFIRHLKTSQP